MRLRLLALGLVAGLLAACGASDSTGATTTPATTPAATAGSVALPPAGGKFSYQIGGAYTPPAGARIVDRDRHDRPAGAYPICYVNAYQAQAEERAAHPSLLLRDRSGHLVIDTDWDEPLFDISTTARRTALLAVVGGWIDGCARAGYRAVEADNLDSYTRSHGLLTAADALAFGRSLAQRAHRDHVALAQKNAADLSAAAHRAGFDFAVAEECQVYDECDAYTDVYGAHVIEIEYTDQPQTAFTKACALRGRTVSVVLRDRDVLPAGRSGHVERWCS